MTQEHILRDQFNSLEQEIQKSRQQQKAIVMLLEQPTSPEQNMVNKERWVEIMKAAGLNEQDIKKWNPMRIKNFSNHSVSMQMKSLK